MSNELSELERVLKAISKAKGVKLFFSLREPKTWSDLEKVACGDKNSVSRRITDFLNLGLVKVEYNRRERRPYYSLTSKGLKILEILEKIEKVYRDKKKGDDNKYS